ncbi:MAG: hypothetical protein AAGB04_18555 [Pseudomonadota bacterium]
MLLRSFLDYKVWDNGRIHIERTDVAFAPESPRGSTVVIRTQAGERLAEYKFGDLYRVKEGVFGRMAPPGAAIHQLGLGKYQFDYVIGGKVVTSVPFSIVADSVSEDPYAPKTTVRFVGPWQQWAYLATDSQNDKSGAAYVHFWAGRSDLPAGQRRSGYTIRVYRDGRLIANSNPQTGHIANDWMAHQREFLQVPHAAGQSHTARNVTMADLAKPGAYKVTVELNDSKKIIRTFHFSSASGQITPNPRTVLRYRPATDHVVPRAQYFNLGLYRFEPIHWIEARPGS